MGVENVDEERMKTMTNDNLCANPFYRPDMSRFELYDAIRGNLKINKEIARSQDGQTMNTAKKGKAVK